MSRNQDDTADFPHEVATDELSDAVLDEAIRLFIQPEGADFGMSESALQSKERVIRKQLSTGSLKVISDPGTESITLMSSQDWRMLESKIRAATSN